MRKALHLATRFFGSLRPGGPSAADEAWAESHLLPGEVEVWRRMSDPDRRHAVGVARAVGSHERPVTAAALLHDSGKVVAGLGTFARVPATLLGLVHRRWGGRVGDYLRHDELGARLLADAGSDPLTVAWAREHHLPPERWTVDPAVGAALKAADDD